MTPSTKSLFLKTGNIFKVTSEEALDLHKVLPPNNYVVQFSNEVGFYLQVVEKFSTGSKLYGDIEKNADRILYTFKDRPYTTGVMLAGEKGSGKTLLAKTVSIKALKDGIPTIIINAPWRGDDFNAFIQKIEQASIILFDEFEKVYNPDHQQQVLTLFDGVYPTKKLFLLTCNDKWKIDVHMRNRPGRIYYTFDFDGLDANFIREYCLDNLKNLEHIESLCRFSSIFEKFNFDMLKAYVEEINRFNVSPQEASKFLNAKPDNSNTIIFNIEVIHKNKKLPSDQLITRIFQGFPIARVIDIEYTFDEKDKEDRDWQTLEISQDDLKTIDHKNGLFVFEKDNFVIEFRRKRETVSRWYDGAF